MATLPSQIVETTIMSMERQFDPRTEEFKPVLAAFDPTIDFEPFEEYHTNLLYPKRPVQELAEEWLEGKSRTIFPLDNHGCLRPHPYITPVYLSSLGRFTLIGYGEQSGQVIIVKPHPISRRQFVLDALRGLAQRTYLDIGISYKKVDLQDGIA